MKLADGTYFVGDSGDGAQSANSQLFVESEVAIANVRWLPLDISRVVTRGDKWVQPDLSRVDEIGFADLLPGQRPRVGRLRERLANRGVRNGGEALVVTTTVAHAGGGMARLFDAQSNILLGEVSAEDVKALVDGLEEESSADDDYFIDAATIDLLEERGASGVLIALLRKAVGGSGGGLDVRVEN